MLNRLRLNNSPKPLDLFTSPTNAPDQPDPPMPEIEQQLPTGSDVSCEHLVELVLHLRPLLPGCEWLEEGTLEFLGDFPIDAGDFVNTLVGVRGNRRFAVKHYRLHSSSSYFPTFIVSVLDRLHFFR